ncbi:hypothetical protein FOZ60_016566, partial [Perkinsus olseni]
MSDHVPVTEPVVELRRRSTSSRDASVELPAGAPSCSHAKRWRVAVRATRRQCRRADTKAPNHKEVVWCYQESIFTVSADSASLPLYPYTPAKAVRFAGDRFEENQGVGREGSWRHRLIASAGTDAQPEEPSVLSCVNGTSCLLREASVTVRRSRTDPASRVCADDWVLLYSRAPVQDEMPSAAATEMASERDMAIYALVLELISASGYQAWRWLELSIERVRFQLPV